MRSLAFISSLAVVTGAVAAAPLRFASGENRTHLVELYSSEGCSSCPPAEAWLGGLRAAPGLWRDFVPVAFHVVYWDHLGWRDRFARKEFTERQYAYSGQWSRDTVYTPGFVLDGAEWRRSSGQDTPPPSAEKAGLLSLEYADGGVCRVRYDRPGEWEVHVVLLGGGISSNVRAGENEGRVLHHEFVALALQSARLRNSGAPDPAAEAAEVTLPSADREGVTRRALAVWVTRRGELTPLQATGGWLK